MKYKHFSAEEREIIQRGLWERKSIRSIAKSLNRSPASISREINRNVPKERRQYTPRLAHERALEKRRCRGRKDRLKKEETRSYVVLHLKRGWSPEQISQRMKKDGIGNISHEAIYQFVYSQVHRNGWGDLKPGNEDLRIYLRRHRKRRMKKGMRVSRRILRPHGRSIEQRSLVVNERLRIGDFESDSIESINHKPGLNTLVERKTGYVFITKLKDKTSGATMSAIADRIKVLPKHLKHTITFDNGPENSDWKLLEFLTDLEAYFAHAYASWERGTNENTNGLVREYLPKKTDFDTISDDDIQRIEYLLNTRPRKRLNWMTPLEALGVAFQC